MKKWKIYSILLCIFFGLSSCSPPPSPPPNTQQTKVLRYSLSQDPSTLDPQKMDSTSEATLSYHLYEGLMRTHGDQLLYGIAEAYDISTDGLTYTFHLRDARYSDGTPVQAQDFVNAVERMLTNKDASRPFLAFPIKNAARIYNKEIGMEALGVQVIDRKTLEFVLENPTPYFLQLLTLPTFSPIPSETALAYHDGYTLSNGPFRVKRWDRNQSIFLEKNPYYWARDKIKLDQVSIVISSDMAKLYQMFLDQELDLLSVGDDVVSPEAAPYAEHYFNGANDFIRLNMDGSCPLSNKNLRLALNYALDRNTYIEELDSINLTASARYVLPILPGTHGTFGEEYPLEAFPLNGNPQKARSYLNAALGELHLEKPEDIQLEFLVSADSLILSEAQIIQAQWETSLGIRINILPIPYKTHMELDAAHKFQMSLSGWIPEYADPASYLELWSSNSSYNYASYHSDAYDECLQTANRQIDMQSRMSLLARAEEILLQDGALIPLQIRKSTLLKNPKLTHFLTYYTSAEYEYIYADFTA